ncbi:hypothetical protein B4135_0278 [Caldibacillus debilis]|uniref:Uncharacterized protein n=1 Tax=Caldibacillus debilis TaxID=301148 RepID=A0A150MDY9_9BACI|nr:hypothetical protein B4135_0278 [Caldibacillus debilis]
MSKRKGRSIKPSIPFRLAGKAQSPAGIGGDFSFGKTEKSACGIFVTVGIYRKNNGLRPILRLRGPFVLKQKNLFRFRFRD